MKIILTLVLSMFASVAFAEIDFETDKNVYRVQPTGVYNIPQYCHTTQRRCVSNVAQDAEIEGESACLIHLNVCNSRSIYELFANPDSSFSKKFSEDTGFDGNETRELAIALIRHWTDTFAKTLEKYHDASEDISSGNDSYDTFGDIVDSDTFETWFSGKYGSPNNKKVFDSLATLMLCAAKVPTDRGDVVLKAGYEICSIKSARLMRTSGTSDYWARLEKFTQEIYWRALQNN